MKRRKFACSSVYTNETPLSFAAIDNAHSVSHFDLSVPKFNLARTSRFQRFQSPSFKPCSPYKPVFTKKQLHAIHNEHGMSSFRSTVSCDTLQETYNHYPRKKKVISGLEDTRHDTSDGEQQQNNFMHSSLDHTVKTYNTTLSSDLTLVPVSSFSLKDMICSSLTQ